MARERKSRDKAPQHKLLHVESGSYRTTLTDKYLNRKPYAEKNPNLVLSFIPGVIQNILVSEGQVVSEGDNLLILEAMKMKNQILSPKEGTIKKIFVKTGERVPKNFTLLEFE